MTTPTTDLRTYLTLAMIEAMPEPADVDRGRATAVIQREHFLVQATLIAFARTPKALERAEDWHFGVPDSAIRDRVLGAHLEWYSERTCTPPASVAVADDVVAELEAGGEINGTTFVCMSPGHCALGAMMVGAGRSNGYVAMMGGSPHVWCYADQLLLWKAFGLTVAQATEIYRENDREPSDYAQAMVREDPASTAIVDERKDRVVRLIHTFRINRDERPRRRNVED